MFYRYKIYIVLYNIKMPHKMKNLFIFCKWGQLQKNEPMWDPEMSDPKTYKKIKTM